jgi:membrane associated rhomboid family serine protease
MSDPVRLSALVDALVIGKSKTGEASALLVQKNERDAVLLVSAVRATTFFFLHQDGDALDTLPERMTGALSAERSLVVDGVQKDLAVVVFYGGAPPAAELPGAHHGLGCRMLYVHIGADGKIARLSKTANVKGAVGVMAAVEATIAEALGAKGAVASEAALRESERAGEHVLAAEGDYDRRVKQDGPWWRMSVVHIAALWIAIFIAQSVMGGFELWPAAIRMGGFDREAVGHGAFYLLLSAGLLHAGFEHIAGNLYGLVYTSPLQLAVGSGRYLALYVVGCAGGFATAMLFGERFSVGGSGGVFALLAALFAMARSKTHEFFPPRVRRGVYVTSAIYLGLNVFFTFQPGVSKGGHFGGALVGLIAVWTGILTWRLPELDRGTEAGAIGNQRSRILGYALLAVMVASVAWSVADEQPWILKAPPAEKAYAIPNTPWKLSLPAVYGEPTVKTLKDGDEQAWFGHIMRFPISVAVTHGKESDKPLEDTRDSRMNKGPGGTGKWVTPPEIVEKNGRRFVHSSARYGKIVEEIWLTRSGGQYVELNVGSWQNASDAWRAVAARGPDLLILPAD